MKESSKILASHLKEKNLLTLDTFYSTCEKDLLSYFSSEENLFYSSNVQDIMQKIGFQKYKPSDWHLYIDTSERSL